MTDPAPLDACFIVNPDINARSLAPEQRRAKRSSYYAEQGFGAFPDEISQEGGPDRSVYLMGARWEGSTHMASQEDDMRDGYFISARKTGQWRWVLWRCSWDDNEAAWWWSSAGATSWATKDPAAAGWEMIRRLGAYTPANLGTATAGDIVANLMRDLGYTEGPSRACPPGCIAKTGLTWVPKG